MCYFLYFPPTLHIHAIRDLKAFSSVLGRLREIWVTKKRLWRREDCHNAGLERACTFTGFLYVNTFFVELAVLPMCSLLLWRGKPALFIFHVCIYFKTQYLPCVHLGVNRLSKKAARVEGSFRVQCIVSLLYPFVFYSTWEVNNTKLSDAATRPASFERFLGKLFIYMNSWERQISRLSEHNIFHCRVFSRWTEVNKGMNESFIFGLKLVLVGFMLRVLERLISTLQSQVSIVNTHCSDCWWSYVP